MLAHQLRPKPGVASGGPKPSAARPRIAVVARDAITHEYTTRVTGDAWRVCEFVSNYSNLPQWYPGVKASHSMNAGAPIERGSQFTVEQTIAGFKLTTIYQVVEYVPEKKIVLMSKSDLHTSTEQYVFMPDPNNKDNFTFIRYMSSIELTEWRQALKPVVQRPIEKMTEGALTQLTRLLNSANTPLKSIPPRPRSRRGGSTSSSSWSSMDNATTSGSEGGAAGFFASVGRGAASAATSAAASAAGGVFNRFFGDKGSGTANVEGDVLGYYKALGLKAADRSLSEDDVKVAFRKKAQTMHPDKLGPDVDAKAREKAEASFKKVQIAYKVLRDPDTRSRYNAGEQIRPEVTDQ